MKTRTGVLVLVSVSAFASLPARAGERRLDSIRSLNAAVAALNARVSKLEGNIEAADLAGTYQLAAYGGTLSPLVTNPGPPPTVVENARIANFVISGTATVNADGTGSLDIALSGIVLTQGTWAVAPGTFGGSEAFTWTYANGVVTVATEEGDNINFNVGPGGRLMVGVVNESDGETDLLIMTRL
jgi:hypothetical protein